jgi:ribulose-phosphate 3-epimerase
MIAEPDRLVPQFLAAGAARVAVHWEAATHLEGLLSQIRGGGARAGVAINPATPVELLADVLEATDFVLLMSVNPGFAGQRFIPQSIAKLRRLKALVDRSAPRVEIVVDGGVGPANIQALAAAGADACVVGSALFGSAEPAAMVAELKRLATTAETV